MSINLIKSGKGFFYNIFTPETSKNNNCVTSWLVYLSNTTNWCFIRIKYLPRAQFFYIITFICILWIPQESIMHVPPYCNFLNYNYFASKTKYIPAMFLIQTAPPYNFSFFLRILKVYTIFLRTLYTQIQMKEINFN